MSDTKFKPGNTAGKKFSSDYQPENRGRKGKAVSEILRELGEGESIELNYTITKKDGQKKTKNVIIESKAGTSINEIVAVTLLQQAIKGDHKARKELLDRQEGRARSFVDITSNGETVLTPEERKSKIQRLREKLKGGNN